jgi:hypothetical protein
VVPGASLHVGHARASVCTPDCRGGCCDASLTRSKRSLQAADGREVNVVGPRYIRLCFASRESCNRFLPLMGRQLAGPAEFDAALLRTLATSPVRARINSRSNSARAPRTVNINRPCGLVLSAQVSFKDLKPAPRLVTDDVEQILCRAGQPV